jgi:hypothetical protein
MVTPEPVAGGAHPLLWLDPDTSAPAGTRCETVHIAAIGRAVNYLVWLPPGYADRAPDAARRYPVIYWLHGLSGNQRAGAPFVKLLSEATHGGIAPPAICVLVNGLLRSMYTDAHDGTASVEQVIVRDLIPHVDASYQTIGGREGCAIEGRSMGGFGAARLGFGHPELFSAVSISAGALHTEETLAACRPELFSEVYGSDAEYFRCHSRGRLWSGTWTRFVGAPKCGSGWERRTGSVMQARGTASYSHAWGWRTTLSTRDGLRGRG